MATTPHSLGDARFQRIPKSNGVPIFAHKKFR
jgi:hypothetical protein